VIGIFEASLVCGSCRSYFPFGNFVNFVQHKKNNCEELIAGDHLIIGFRSSKLLSFTSCWYLCF